MKLLHAVAIVALALRCLAQPTPPDPQGGAQEDPAVSGQMPPEAALGLRAEMVRRGVPHIPVLVLTPDGRSFAEAVGRWRLDGRFPVLIDDGSAEATEHVARFVRAYGPQRVVRWSAQGAGDEGTSDLVTRVIDAAWGGEGTLADGWAQVGSAPPGVVVARRDDPAWVAAVALGAGRGQPVIWVEGGRRNVNGAMTDAEADELARQIEEGCEALGYPWRGIGDAIETVALCMNTPARLKKGDEHFAVTDRIGRHGDGERWAWAGQIFGGEVQASYQAMCALFLPIRKAWLFDGYPSGEPWSEYDMTSAGNELERRGLEVTIVDEPTHGASHWRTQSARALSADLVMVNTKGPAEIFNLQPGPCRAADVPLLDRPVAVHFIHSWSVVRPGARRTVGGRWIERGAYAYYGSTEEPFLQSFLTPLLVARRLYAPAPFSVAARRPGQLWKLAYFGDPLLTAGTAAERTEKALPLEGFEDLGEMLPALLRAGEYGESARVLVLLGRDADLVRLAQGVLKDEAQSFADMAPHVALAAFRERDRSLVAQAIDALGEEDARAAGRQDALWSVYWPRLGGGLEADVLRSLAANIREGNEVRDATELAPAMADVLGRDAALSMLRRVRAGLTREWDLEEIDAMVARLGG